MCYHFRTITWTPQNDHDSSHLKHFRTAVANIHTAHIGTLQICYRWYQFFPVCHCIYLFVWLIYFVHLHLCFKFWLYISTVVCGEGISLLYRLNICMIQKEKQTKLYYSWHWLVCNSDLVLLATRSSFWSIFIFCMRWK